MNLSEIVDRALSGALSEGAEQAEAFTVRSRTLSLYVEDSKVKNLEEKVDHGLAVRAVEGSRLGEASSTIGLMNHVDTCVSSAIKVTRASAPDPNFMGFAIGGASTIPAPGVWDKVVAQLDPETLSSKGMEVVEACVADGDMKVPRGLIRTANIETEVGNSNGMSAAHRNTMVYLHFTSMTSSGKAGEGEERFHSTRLDMDAAGIGKALARGARNSADAVAYRGRTDVPVFIGPGQLAEMFASSIGFSVDSENVNRMRSAWTAKLGEQVTSPELTIIDDPSDPRGILSATHDDEGVPTRRKPIIERGTLRSFLYDTYNGSMAGVDTTGNGMRRDPINSQNIYQNQVSVSPMNMVVSAGSWSTEELLASFDEAVLIERFAWPQVNPITGSIGLEVRCAHILEGGEVSRTVKHALLTGNMFESLSRVVGIADDQRVRGSWILPTMGFDGMKLVGNP